MKKYIVIFIVFFLSFINIVMADTTIESVTFVRCVDGDTAIFSVNGEEIKFRFLAIDTPETVHPTKDVEAYGKDASEYTCNRLTNAENIIIEYEVSNKTDKYGRSLGWIWVDGFLLQKELVSIGYGEVAYIYGKYRYTESLCLAQKNAKEESLGMWSEDKEEGYCSTVDLNGVSDNIIYEQIGYIESSPAPEEDEEKEITDHIKEMTEKVEEYDFLDDPNISKYYTIGFLACAFIAFVIKELKK